MVGSAFGASELQRHTIKGCSTSGEYYIPTRSKIRAIIRVCVVVDRRLGSAQGINKSALEKADNNGPLR